MRKRMLFLSFVYLTLNYKYKLMGYQSDGVTIIVYSSFWAKIGQLYGKPLPIQHEVKVFSHNIIISIGPRLNYPSIIPDWRKVFSIVVPSCSKWAVDINGWSSQPLCFSHTTERGLGLCIIQFYYQQSETSFQQQRYRIQKWLELCSMTALFLDYVVGH